VYVKVIDPKKHGKTAYNNSGSCRALVNYLSKEDKNKGVGKESFFSHDKDQVLSIDVIKSIDNNRPLIGKNEAKFYSLVVAPRPDEMEHIKNDKTMLKAYVRDTMDIYAGNFNKKDGTSKNLTGSDLVYFAKVEENRYYKGTDEAVKQGTARQGDVLEGDNTHVHIIVSRQDRTQRIKLSPLANSKKLFSRENFKLSSCLRFDEHYKYQGAGKELEKHIVMRDGSMQEREDYFMKEYERIKAPHYTEENHQEEKKKAKKKIKPRNRSSM
jgi:Family of unknown function (DUF5712)